MLYMHVCSLMGYSKMDRTICDPSKGLTVLYIYEPFSRFVRIRNVQFQGRMIYNHFKDAIRKDVLLSRSGELEKENCTSLC